MEENIAGLQKGKKKSNFKRLEYLGTSVVVHVCVFMIVCVSHVCVTCMHVHITGSNLPLSLDGLIPVHGYILHRL